MRSNSVKRIRSRGQRGFTLIELLVVIAIIAILALLILAALNSAQKGARDSRRQSDINQYKTALANYYSDKQEYPEAQPALTIDDAPETEPCTSLRPNYLASCLTPPSGSYYYWATTTTFHVCATLERDTAKMFAAGPTETKKILGVTAAWCRLASLN